MSLNAGDIALFVIAIILLWAKIDGWG